jgi:hypothetical protein
MLDFYTSVILDFLCTGKIRAVFCELIQTNLIFSGHGGLRQGRITVALFETSGPKQTYGNSICSQLFLLVKTVASKNTRYF